MHRFLEDGDLHTDYKRERQFKWAGLDDRIEVGKLKIIFLNPFNPLFHSWVPGKPKRVKARRRRARRSGGWRRWRRSGG